MVAGGNMLFSLAKLGTKSNWLLRSARSLGGYVGSNIENRLIGFVGRDFAVS